MLRGISEIAIPLTEAQVKLAVIEYLTLEMNLGNLWFARLNAGDFIELRGKTRRRIKGAEKGTADLIVIQPEEGFWAIQGKGKLEQLAKVTFIECKSSEKSKQSYTQITFEREIKKMHCHYYVVRSVEQVMEILWHNRGER